MGAEFEVVYIDPDGSGMDWSGHLGKLVRNAKRCCTNCTVIFGSLGDNDQFGPFVPGELAPLNDEAENILNEINSFRMANGYKTFTWPRKNHRCDCGAVKANTTHANWCSAYERSQ